MQRYNHKINIRYYVTDEGKRGIYKKVKKVTQGRGDADKKVMSLRHKGEGMQTKK